MVELPLHKFANKFLKESELETAEKRAIYEGEVIYGHFTKDTAGSDLKPATPEHVNHWSQVALHNHDGSSTGVTDAYANYTHWAKGHGHEAHTWQDFSKHMAEKGYVKQHLGGKMRYIGIRLNSEPIVKESEEPVESEQVIQEIGPLTRLALKGVAGLARGAVKGTIAAHKLYKQKQADKTKTYHTVLYSADEGKTFHYHSHHETRAGADKAHQNLENFDVPSEHIVHLHLNKDEIGQAKANTNHFIIHQHAKILNGMNEPNENHMRQAASGPDKPKAPKQVSGEDSFKAWHQWRSGEKGGKEFFKPSAWNSGKYSDYRNFAQKQNHKPVSFEDFDHHMTKHGLNLPPSNQGEHPGLYDWSKNKATSTVKPSLTTPKPSEPAKGSKDAKNQKLSG